MFLEISLPKCSPSFTPNFLALPIAKAAAAPAILLPAGEGML